MVVRSHDFFFICILTSDFADNRKYIQNLVTLFQFLRNYFTPVNTLKNEIQNSSEVAQSGKKILF